MKLNCIAVDDEKYALELLVDNINRVPYLNLVASCKNAKEAAEALRNNSVQLIFIDIQMPGMSGLQFIESMPVKPLVIFITAFDNYALKAFSVDAIDYLVKPVSFERFLQATNKALSFSSYHIQPAIAEPEFIFINVEYNLVKLVLSDVLYMEGVKDYIKIHFTDPRKNLLTRNTMKGILEILPVSQFVRIHRSYIVALKSISVIKKDTILLTDQQTSLPVSDSHRAYLSAILSK
ncbi:MAG: LytR/AlgR family response regulator transcription factor [Sediminibacterium sp.]